MNANELDAIAYQSHAAKTYIASRAALEIGEVDKAVFLQHAAARAYRWARETMNIEPVTYLD